MRVAVSAQEPKLESKIDPRFGRAHCFVVYDSGDESVEIIENSDSDGISQGAGVQTAQRIADKNVNLVVSGNIGPKALKALNAAGIKTALRQEGTVSEAIELARDNRLEICDEANVEGHWS
jgi:predicted Fe-Mo cluster-binding NifX family protein